MVQLGNRFSTKIDEFANRVLFRLDDTVQESMYQAGILAQKLSPVLTGRFRDSWRIAQGVPDTSTSPASVDLKKAARAVAGGKAKSFGESVRGVSAPPSSVIGALRSQSGNVRVGGLAILSNSVEYADVVERGDPKTNRPPTLITRRVLDALPDIVRRAAVRAAGRIG